jgi:hypothetical protein
MAARRIGAGRRLNLLADLARLAAATSSDPARYRNPLKDFNSNDRRKNRPPAGQADGDFGVMAD